MQDVPGSGLHHAAQAWQDFCLCSPVYFPCTATLRLQHSGLTLLSCCSPRPFVLTRPCPNTVTPWYRHFGAIFGIMNWTVPFLRRLSVAELSTRNEHCSVSIALVPVYCARVCVCLVRNSLAGPKELNFSVFAFGLSLCTARVLRSNTPLCKCDAPGVTVVVWKRAHVWTSGGGGGVILYCHLNCHTVVDRVHCLSYTVSILYSSHGSHMTAKAVPATIRFSGCMVRPEKGTSWCIVLCCSSTAHNPLDCRNCVGQRCLCYTSPIMFYRIDFPVRQTVENPPGGPGQHFEHRRPCCMTRATGSAHHGPKDPVSSCGNNGAALRTVRTARPPCMSMGRL